MVDQGTASQLRGQLSQSAAGGDMAASLTAAVTLLQKLQQQQQGGGVTQVALGGCDQPPMALTGLTMDRRGSSNLDRIPSSSSLPGLVSGNGGGAVCFGQPQPRRKMLVFQRQRNASRTAFTPSSLRQPSAAALAAGQTGDAPSPSVNNNGQPRGQLPSPGAASSTTSGGSKRGLGSVVAGASPVAAKAPKSSKRLPQGGAAEARSGSGGGGVASQEILRIPSASSAAAGGGGGGPAQPPVGLAAAPAAAGGGGGASQLQQQPLLGVIPAAAGLDKSSSSPDLITLGSSSSSAAASDESVAVQQARALVKVLGRLTVDQLTACRPLLPQILAKSAPLLVPYCAAVLDMVGQCIAARQSNGGQTLSPEGCHQQADFMMQGLQQLTGAAAAATPAAAASGAAGGDDGQRRSTSPGGLTAAVQEVQEASCMDYEMATSLQVSYGGRGGG
jgi:hypothetical protein